MIIRIPLALLLCAAVTVGCTGQAPEVFVAVDVSPSPWPAGEPVLEIQTSTSTTFYDLAELEAAFPLHDGTVFEPFEEEHLAFTGVLLRDVLAHANPGGANEVELIALDDYHVVFALEDVQGEDTLLATRQGGALIPIDEGGPIRVVFTAGSELGANPDLWIWSVASMELR
jgi:hypothetical protein